MKKNLQITLLTFSLIVLLIQGTSFALNPATHKEINLRVAGSTMNGFSLNQYLKDNLDIVGGVGETFDGKRIDFWLRDGGLYEDVPYWYMPYLRSVNHFHNPLTEKGYSGIWGTGFLSGMSSIQWALLPPATQSPGGYYSWYDLRGYYLTALTSQDPNVRNTNFAETFRGLGQIMHLVQDASVPAHTRDDAHVRYNYEKWVAQPGNMSISNPVLFSGNINTIASFIDTNQYNGANPEVTLSNTAGLSEYTNANFFSEDTIFSPDFPNPNKEETNAALIEVHAEDGEIDMVYYVYRNGQSYRLAAYSYFFDDLSDFIILDGWKYNLDDNVYSDYASFLLPRAVGHSASLINYFFRGQIDIVEDSQNPGKYVIKNLSNESMSGTFSLYYDDTYDNRYLVGEWSLSINPGGQSEPVEFTEPTDAKEKGRYILVFSGTLGAETDAVAGKVVTLEEKEELILYAIGSEYKTYNPKTGEVKPYNGILTGATGKVIWREDGKAALAVQGGLWYLVDLEKGTKSAIMSSSSFSTGGWRGDTIVMALMTNTSRIYFREILPDGNANDYLLDVPLGIRPISSATSWDGEKISFGGYVDSYYIRRDYYLLHFDTSNKGLTVEKVGERWYYVLGNTIIYYKTNDPYLMAYYHGELRVFYRNYTDTEITQQVGICENLYTTIRTREATYQYSILGETTGSLKQTFICGNSFHEEAVSAKPPLGYVIRTDGVDIIPYTLNESSSYISPTSRQFTYRVTPYLYVGGTEISGSAVGFDSVDTFGTWRNDSILNLNAAKDKAAGFINVYGYYYVSDIKYSDGIRMAFYVSYDSIDDITSDNPDFQLATFFAFIKE